MAPAGRPAWNKNKVRKESKSMEKYMTGGKNDSEDHKKDKKGDRGKHMQEDEKDDGIVMEQVEHQKRVEERKINKRRRKKGE